MILAKSFQAGDKFATHLTYTLALCSFHFSTIEEYYTGGLDLGPGNGVSDGTAFVCGIFIIMGIFGNDWMLEPIFGEIRYGDVSLAAVGLLAFFTIFACFKGILNH